MDKDDQSMADGGQNIQSSLIRIPDEEEKVIDPYDGEAINDTETTQSEQQP